MLPWVRNFPHPLRSRGANVTNAREMQLRFCELCATWKFRYGTIVSYLLLASLYLLAQVSVYHLTPRAA